MNALTDGTVVTKSMMPSNVPLNLGLELLNLFLRVAETIPKRKNCFLSCNDVLVSAPHDFFRLVEVPLKILQMILQSFQLST